MIRVAGLSVSYGAVRALRDVSFDVPTGQVTAVIGSNGAGKTTLLRTISGLVRPAAGSIDFDGLELVGLRTEAIARRGIGHVPEGRGVIEEFTVLDNLRLGSLHGRGKLAAGLETQFELSDAPDGGTAMHWTADVRIAGPVGSMGQRVLQPIVNQQVQQVLTALDREVQAASGPA